MTVYVVENVSGYCTQLMSVHSSLNSAIEGAKKLHYRSAKIDDLGAVKGDWIYDRTGQLILRGWLDVGGGAWTQIRAAEVES